jgi:Pyruvate/2-oxoacid:ferredoxin oxidoreductase delta subunit
VLPPGRCIENNSCPSCVLGKIPFDRGLLFALQLPGAGHSRALDKEPLMCEFCTKHGDGKIWYKNAANYAQDLLSDVRRRAFIAGFLESTMKDGFAALGRLETLYRRKGRLHPSIVRKMEEQARVEHFGQVLPIEEIRELVLGALTVVRMPCACRWTAGKKEVRCCYGISFGPEPWYRDLDMNAFGTPSNEKLETVSAQEAIAQMERLEGEGAIHTIWTMVSPFIGAVCNCSARECLAMRTVCGLGVETMARAEYAAAVDASLCTGCGLCAETCQFDAIASDQSSGEDIAAIDAHRCFGCGLCRNACTVGAITLVPR